MEGMWMKMTYSTKTETVSVSRCFCRHERRFTMVGDRSGRLGTAVAVSLDSIIERSWIRPSSTVGSGVVERKFNLLVPCHSSTLVIVGDVLNGHLQATIDVKLEFSWLVARAHSQPSQRSPLPLDTLFVMEVLLLPTMEPSSRTMIGVGIWWRRSHTKMSGFPCSVNSFDNSTTERTFD
jgi:hypothetical protein